MDENQMGGVLPIKQKCHRCGMAPVPRTNAVSMQTGLHVSQRHRRAHPRSRIPLNGQRTKVGKNLVGKERELKTVRPSTLQPPRKPKKN